MEGRIVAARRHKILGDSNGVIKLNSICLSTINFSRNASVWLAGSIYCRTHHARVTGHCDKLMSPLIPHLKLRQIQALRMTCQKRIKPNLTNVKVKPQNSDLPGLPRKTDWYRMPRPRDGSAVLVSAGEVHSLRHHRPGRGRKKTRHVVIRWIGRTSIKMRC